MDFTKTIGDNALAQERFTIGRIASVIKDASKDVYDAIIEITNPAAREAIEKHEIPFYVSPRIINPDQKQHEAEDWFVMHHAIVSDPAFGVDKAGFKGACYGMADQCRLALKEASVQNDCGFCVKTELLKLVNNTSTVTSSQFADASISETLDTSTSVQIDTSKFVSVEDYNALKSQVDAFKVAAEQAKSQYQSELDALKEERRTEKITAIVDAKIPDKAKAADTIKKFVDGKVTPEIVADAMALIPEPKKEVTSTFSGTVKDASANPKAGSYARYQSYVNSQIRGATL